MKAVRRAVVFNPRAGGRPGGDLARRVRDLLEREGPVELLPTERGGHACELVEDLLASRASGRIDVVVLGGDGTLNEAVLGAWRAGAFREGGPDVRFAALPAGTTNVVARSLGFPRDPLEAARRLSSGRERAIDLGACRFESSGAAHDGRADVDRPFVLACGIGIDADVVRGVSPRLKRWIGRHAYTVAALRLAGRREMLTIEWEDQDGRAHRADAASAIVANTPLYGGAVRLSGGARLDDGLLELALLSDTRLAPLVLTGLVASLASFERVPGVRVTSVRSARIAGATPTDVHVDAEPSGATPISLRVLPRALVMRVPD